MFRTALRNVLAHKARLLMTLLAVMLGVAFVSGTLVFSDTLSNAFRGQTAKGYDKIAVGVTTYSSRDQKEPGVPAATVDKINRLDGVAHAAGRVDGFAGVDDGKGKLIGSGWANKGANFAPGADGEDERYSFVQGHGPASADEVALDRETASKGDYKVGDRVRVATNGPVKEYTLAGVYTTDDGGVSAGGSLVLFDTEVAQKLYLKPGYFANVQVTAKPGASADTLLSEIKPMLPKDAEAKTGKALADEEAKSIDEGMSGLKQMLLAFAGIALFVGVFLISNTFTMLVAQRTKELALMRAVGASRKQITRSVLLEALVVGVLASVVGIALGLGLAAGLRSGMAAFGMKVPAGPLVVSPAAIVSGLVVGVLVTVIAAWLPGRRAARIPPVAAMSSVHAIATTKSLVLRNSIGAVITLIGAAGIVGGAAIGKEGKYVIGAGAFFALIGLIVLIPLLSRPVIALIRPLLVKGFGVSGKLAAQNAVRNPRRTGATASALAIGLTLVTGLSVLGISVGQAIEKTTTDNIRADYMIQMAAGGMNLDPSALTAVRKAPGVEAAMPQQNTYAEVGGSGQTVTAVVPGDLDKVLNVTTVEGSLDSLAQGRIAVDRETAGKQGWKVGQAVPVKFADDKTGELTIGAVYEGNDMLSSVAAPLSVVKAHDSDPYVPQILVKMKGGETAANEQALVDALGKNPAISVMDKQDIRDTFGGMINMLLNIMYGLLAMALVIAVLGVVNTLAMSVFERQQEIGMLRAIGLDRPRVKRMIRLEAVVISVFGALVGVAMGTFLGWAIGQTVKDSIPHYAMVIPWDRIGVFLLLAALVGVLAAMWPARSAAKLNMLNAIKAE
ncbi:FtsX-like permease family protein [Streptomyces sp. NPDC001941]|uniref:ABC transporter permease n=1 Tax=Streptomyces sp. NPDC001941 TaxID=3154659 RepID=UPI003317DC66